MITAVDANIILDVLVPDETFGESSKALLDYHLSSGQLILCEIIYAEHFEVTCLECSTALARRLYFLANSVIGTNALVDAERALSRDIEVCKAYFSDFKVVSSLLPDETLGLRSITIHERVA